MVSGICAVACWLGLIAAVYARVKHQDREDAKAARLRRLGDRQWQEAEHALWRCGVDPCPDLLLDLDEGDTDEFASTLEGASADAVLRRARVESGMSACAGCGVELPPSPHGSPSRKWCSDRCRKTQYAGACEVCGALTNGSNGRGPNAGRFCADHAMERTVAARRERARAHRELVERLWAEGKTIRELQEAVGSKTNVSTMRARGYNLPHRRTPEQIARITAGADERLAQARAARGGRWAAA